MVYCIYSIPKQRPARRQAASGGTPAADALTTIPSSIEPLTKEQMKTEYRKRTEIIKDQLNSIQQSFLVIAFQLYWIKENAMFPSAYKNIYEFADVEYGISRSTCGNLIYIVDTYAERDGDGRVLESLEGRYRDFSASQLIAMAGMPEEDREKVRPDMSVRMINRMRKQEAQARLGSGREADTAQKDTAGTDPRTVPGQEEPAAARAAAGSETAEDSREPQTSAGISTDRPHTEKDAPAAGASPETETGEPDGKAPGTDTGRDGDGIPAGRGSCPVRTVCLGLAASMGAVIFAGGDSRDILPHARVMLHDPLTAGGGIASALQLKREAVDFGLADRIVEKIMTKIKEGRP